MTNMDNGQKINSWLRMAATASLTLGLAPFFPEPHIWGKVRWIWGGAVGMQGIDWFDFFLHGTPWFFLIGILTYKGLQLAKVKGWTQQLFSKN
jgi:hypothetical protein